MRVFDQGFQKPMKALGLRPRAFIVSSIVLLFRVKHDARVSDMASKTIHPSLVIRGYCFIALISHESMYFKNHQCGNFVVIRCKSYATEDGSLLQRITKAVIVLQKLGRRIKVAARRHF